LLESTFQGNRLAKKFQSKIIQEDILEILRSERKKGVIPFKIVHKKTAVELVREGRVE